MEPDVGCPACPSPYYEYSLEAKSESPNKVELAIKLIVYLRLDPDLQSS